MPLTGITASLPATPTNDGGAKAPLAFGQLKTISSLRLAREFSLLAGPHYLVVYINLERQEQQILSCNSSYDYEL